MPLGTLIDITRPYSPTMAWAYDTLIAQAVERLVRSVVEELAETLPQGASILDVGCGGGHVLKALGERRPDLTLAGVDLCAEQVKRARTRLRAAGHPASVYEGSALQLPLEAGSVDHVVSVASLKHWPNRRLGLHECLRVLGPMGGLTIVEVDRGCSNTDSLAFIADWPVPRVTRPLALAMFRTWVAGPSVDLEEARSLVASLDAGGLAVSRLEGTPMLVIRRRP